MYPLTARPALRIVPAVHSRWRRGTSRIAAPPITRDCDNIRHVITATVITPSAIWIADAAMLGNESCNDVAVLVKRSWLSRTGMV